MKKLLIILLTAFILGGSMHVDEMARIPFLMQHFSEHQAQYPSDTFLTFLYKHYLANQQPASVQDQSSDSKLPFKSNQAVETHFTICTLPESAGRHTFIQPVKLTFHYIETKVRAISFDIWQPPQQG